MFHFFHVWKLGLAFLDQMLTPRYTIISSLGVVTIFVLLSLITALSQKILIFCSPFPGNQKNHSTLLVISSRNIVKLSPSSSYSLGWVDYITRFSNRFSRFQTYFWFSPIRVCFDHNWVWRSKVKLILSLSWAQKYG